MMDFHRGAQAVSSSNRGLPVQAILYIAGKINAFKVVIDKFIRQKTHLRDPAGSEEQVVRYEKPARPCLDPEPAIRFVEFNFADGCFGSILDPWFSQGAFP
jgi:hypothetical protein